MRAHRARVAGRHADALAGIAEVEAVAAELRRAVLTGQPTADVFARLTDATRRLAPRLDARASAPRESPAEPSVTNPVAKKSLRRSTVRPEPINPDTVSMERDPGSGSWPVSAGLAADPSTVIRVGVLEPAYGTGRRVRGWHATRNLVRVPGGPWRTRREATVRLLDQHQRAAEGGRR